LAGCFQDVLELSKDSPGGFGTQIGYVVFGSNGADVGFEHHIELLGLGEAAGFAAVWTFHLGEGGVVFGQVLGLKIGEMIGTETVLAEFTVDHGVDEGVDVAAGLPQFGILNNRTIEPDDIGVLVYKMLQPGVSDVFCHLGTVGAVVPESGETAINFG